MKTHRSGRDGASGEMAERSKAAVSKIAVRATVPRVRIPLSPPFLSVNSPEGIDQYRFGLFFCRAASMFFRYTLWSVKFR